MQRINKVIRLLEQKIPAYYTQTAEFSYENGLAMANTWADYIRLNLEHGPYDIKGVRDFVLGIKEGNQDDPPAIIAELPFDGSSVEVVRANHWVIKQLLATGIHGFLLCHAEEPTAIKEFIEHMRYSFSKPVEGLDQGKRGHGAQKHAANVWGITQTEYLERADVWPLSQDGELIFGVKIENIRALENCEQTLAIPGISFAEWGPGDMGMSMGYPENHEPPYPQEMADARERVFNACRAEGINFLNAVYNEEEAKECIDEGVMLMRIADGDTTGKLAEFGRAYVRSKNEKED